MLIGFGIRIKFIKSIYQFHIIREFCFKLQSQTESKKYFLHLISINKSLKMGFTAGSAYLESILSTESLLDTELEIV